MSLRVRMHLVERWLHELEVDSRQAEEVDGEIRRVAREYGVSFRQLRENYLRIVPGGVITANNLSDIGKLERQAELLAEQSSQSGT